MSHGVRLAAIEMMSSRVVKNTARLCSKWHTCLLLTAQYTVHTAYYF